MTNVPVITSMRMTTSKPRRPPRAGDRRITKAHGLQIRVAMRDSVGRFIVSGGRQLYEWRKPEALRPWDRHLLSTDERKLYFPLERALGYMQGRGAA